MIQRPVHSARNVRYRPCGFAAILAISLIILVGMALATLTTYFALEANRTRSQADQAQLRQLLTAGAVAALQHADTGGAKVSLDLPKDLAGASVTIEINGSGDTKTALITAAFNQRTSSQTLTLHRNATGEKARWSIVAAELDTAASPPTAQPPASRSSPTQPIAPSSAVQSSAAQTPATQPAAARSSAAQSSYI